MINIAIDGPAGAGKSTIAKKVAAEKNYIYVDTGAMYRAMALYLYRLGIDPDDSAAISSNCAGADITIEYRDGQQVVLLAGENVNAYLRTPQVSDMASRTSVNGDVRAKLVELQQELARRQNVVPPAECRYGRQGHRHGRASGCPGQNIPHGQCTGESQKEIPGTDGEGRER